MDLYAYSQIEELEHLLTENNIEIGRLRGLRLMKDEEIVTDEMIKEYTTAGWEYYAIQWLQMRSEDTWYSSKADKKHKAFIYKKDESGAKHIAGIDLSKVHGKDRKRLKYAWKHEYKFLKKIYDMFNSYVGKNVLFVHARQGGGNREFYPIDTRHPMYLSDVDSGDGTYCDIYYDLDKSLNKENGK